MTKFLHYYVQNESHTQLYLGKLSIKSKRDGPKLIQVMCAVNSQSQDG